MNEEVARIRSTGAAQYAELFRTYPSLPQPNENPSAVEAYGLRITSSSGAVDLIELTTFLKDPALLSPMSGELAISRRQELRCVKATKSCVVERDQSFSGEYTYGFQSGPCLLGFDAENDRLFSTSCGEGGEAGILIIASKKGGWANWGVAELHRFESLNEQLSKFALKRREGTKKGGDGYFGIFLSIAISATSFGR